MTRESLPFQTPWGDSGEQGSGRAGFLWKSCIQALGKAPP